MVRAPCCQKMGLKKGPWTPEEDQILVAHIQRYGHGNWRALPKQAGLLRCGKSCRLRWTNYLRPDIKRGNFSREEEESIIKLHELLGNRWSTIAARLPGRTDNEIKNVWHTHLKKRLKTDHQRGQESKRKIPCRPINEIGAEPTITKPINSMADQPRFKAPSLASASPSRSYSDISSVATTDSSSSNNNSTKEEFMESSQVFPEIDVSFWSEALSVDSCTTSAIGGSLSPLDDPFNSISSLNNNDMSFWLRVFMEAGDFRELSEI